MNIQKPKKMYVLVRNDLNNVYKSVQGCHAVAQYSITGNPSLYAEWGNGTLVFLGVPNLHVLELWHTKLLANGKEIAPFYEPDLKDQMTAIACIDTGEIFKDLKLA